MVSIWHCLLSARFSENSLASPYLVSNRPAKNPIMPFVVRQKRYHDKEGKKTRRRLSCCVLFFYYNIFNIFNSLLFYFYYYFVVVVVVVVVAIMENLIKGRNNDLYDLSSTI
jgi:hypothetical protein